MVVHHGQFMRCSKCGTLYLLSDVVGSAPAFLTLAENVPVAGLAGLAALAAAMAVAGGAAIRRR